MTSHPLDLSIAEAVIDLAEALAHVGACESRLQTLRRLRDLVAADELAITRLGARDLDVPIVEVKGDVDAAHTDAGAKR